MKFVKSNQLDEQSYFPIWGMNIPSFRTKMNEDRGNLNRFLIGTFGGLGDVVCAEPAIRYALETFKGIEISLCTHYPQLFEHLKFKDVFDLSKKQMPNWQKYFVFKTIYEETHLQWEFINHMHCNSVNYSAINMWRGELPLSYREIVLKPKFSPQIADKVDFSKPFCVVHPGRHWQVKTFPLEWWNAVLYHLLSYGITPVLIGKDVDSATGTVNVDANHCIDLRNKTSMNDLVWLCQQTKVLISNDSSPIHIAASGDAWIGFVSTLKKGDYLKHFRHGEYGWRTKDFGLGGVWDLFPNSMAGNHTETLCCEEVDPEVLLSWLPEPKEIAIWAVEKARS